MKKLNGNLALGSTEWHPAFYKNGVLNCIEQSVKVIVVLFLQVCLEG